MAWSGNNKEDDGGKPRRGYHHGNLREALIEAALDLIGAKGPAGFTFAEAARSAGVSAAAPYRHFRDRDDLLAGVARQGFERFEQFLENAWNGGKPDPVKAVSHLGMAYLAFARTEPAYYSAMFEANIAMDEHPELRKAGDRAFEIVRKAADALSATLPSHPPALMLALHIWAFAHGVASMFAKGDASRRSLPMSPEDLLEAAMLVYLEGLGRPKT